MCRACFGTPAPQLDDAALVAALVEHLVKASGSQLGVLVQGLADKRQIGIGEGRAKGFGGGGSGWTQSPSAQHRDGCPTLGQWCQSSNVRRSEEHTSELQSLRHLVCRLLLE